MNIYKDMGIDDKVYKLSESILEGLSDRFNEIDRIAEINQLKVVKAMQESKVSEACLLGTTGYGYNDIGRDTLEGSVSQTSDYLRNSCSCPCTHEQSSPR